MVFICNIVAGISALFAAKLADQIGLIMTMVVTHMPSNVLLILGEYSTVYIVQRKFGTCSAVQYSTVQYSTVQYILCSTVQYSTGHIVQYSTVHIVQ
jgi:ABC-type dipeptide/oligopeptide/nickel transport system permease component